MEKHLIADKKFSSPEEEISFLREQIKSKEKELVDKKVSVEKANLIRQELSDYAGVHPDSVLSDNHKLSQTEVEQITLNLAPERHDKKIEELYGIMTDKGLRNALSVLYKMKDPHLEDDFHRFLVQYFLKGYKAKGLDVSKGELKGIGMPLFELVLPEDLNKKNDEVGGNLKILISSMEQFFAGMMSLENKKAGQNYMALEIANSNGSDQLIYYIAIPRDHVTLFEKQIVAMFPDARLTEVTNDYNIFNSSGVSLGAHLETVESPVYEFKTYDKFDYDPLNVVLGSFSKIKKDGEGAALQIIFAPSGDFFNKKFKYVIDKIKAGVKTKEAVDLSDSIFSGFGSAFKSIFKSPPKDPEKEIDQKAIEKIEHKMRGQIVAVNARVIVSADTEAEVKTILQGIESSFNQFSDPASNSLKWVEQKGSDLKQLFHDFAFRNYNQKDLLPLNLTELASLIHFHTSTLSSQPHLKQTQSQNAPAPTGLVDSGTFIGLNSFHNTETKVYMEDEDRLRHMYVIGQTGTGKSVFLKNLIIQDIQRGNGCCFIDPHGSDVLDILANIPKDRFKDLIYFDPSYIERPMALNMLEYDQSHPEQKTFVVNELFSIFQKLYGGVPESMGPIFEQYFRNATMLVIEDPESGCTLLDVSRVMANKTFRDLKLSRCKNPVVVEFWKEVAEKAGGEASLANIVPYITSKFDVFLANEIMRPIIAQEKSSFNFREVMDSKKILLVNLSKGRLGDINSNLIGMIIVGKILMAALSRSGESGFPPFYLYIDEFQNITTDSISTILSEARKYKLSLTVAHQFIAQLQDKIRDAVFGNVGSMVSFRVSSDDAEYLEKQFSPTFTAKDIMNIENLNAYVKMLVHGRAEKAFNIKESFPPKGNSAIIETLKQLSYLSYGGNRQEIEAEILKKYKK